MKKIRFLIVFVAFAGIELSAATYYVKKTGDNTKDGLTWATAWSTISKAVTTAAHGDEILVGQGTYNEAITFDVVKSLTFKGGYLSATGVQDYNQKTIIDGTSLNRRFIITNTPTTSPGKIIFDGFTFQNFQDASSGGVLYFRNGFTTDLINCRFINNTSSANHGGAVYIAGTVTTQENNIINCEFYGNNAGTGIGGAVISTGNILYVKNCTFTNNTSNHATYKSSIWSNQRIYIYNSIIWGNTGNQLVLLRAAYTLDRNIIQGGTVNTSNDSGGSLTLINGAAVDANNNDPLFVNQSTGNLNLTATSPAINAGKDLSASGVTTDIMGFTRPTGASKVDLGAYEFITYQSKNTGNWSDYTKWQISADGSTFSDVANASYVPTSSLAGSVNVLNGHEITVAANATARALTVNAGGKLTLSSAIALTASSLTLQSDATNGTGTFLDNGTTTVTGTTTANQYLGTARNWYVASPITNAKAPSTGFTIYKRNEAASSWPIVSNGTDDLLPGTGYIALPTTTGATISFVSVATPTNGKFNQGTVPVVLTKSGSSSNGFNLIGNPYPTHLTWTKAFVEDVTNAALIEPSIYYRTNSGGSNSSGWSFITYNAITDESAPLLAPKGIIPPMQSFWIRAKAAGTLNLDSKLTRSHQSSNLLKAPALKNTDRQKLRLEVSNGTRTDETLLMFDDNAADGYDAFDSYKYMETNSEVQIYTTVNNEKMVMNGMKNMPLDQEIGLGFIPGDASSFSIKANEVSNLPSNVKVILKDNATHAETDLTDGVSTYSFNPATFVGDRFSLIFKLKGTATGINNNEKQNVQVFVNTQNQITIIASEKSKYAIYNAVGQLIENGVLNTKRETVNAQLNSGVYFVTVGNQLTRVIIK